MHAMGIDDAYSVERTLAEGRTGVTERVTIEGSGPFVRKKIPSALANRGVWAALSECRCPRLPQVGATYEMPDRFVVVYDYIPGDTLDHALASCGRLGPAEAVQVVRDVCEAASDLHVHAIVHCDITPSNIILAADGAHLIDLGIARMTGQKHASNAAPLGTWGFAAPEQYGFAPVDGRTDVYALARLLGFLLCGISPDDESFEAALADESVVPAALRDVAVRGAAFEPSARYQSAGELARAAQAALEGRRDAPAASSGAGAFGAHSGAGDSASSAAGPVAGPAEGPSAGRAEHPGAESAVRPASGRRRTVALGIGIGAAAIAAIAVAGLLFANADSVAKTIAAKAPQSASGTGAGTTSDADQASSGAGLSLDPEEIARAAVDSALSGNSSQEESSQGDAAKAVEGLSLVESGWSVGASGYVHYGFALRNDTDDLSVIFPTVKIVGRDADGSVLFSDEQIISRIEPGQTLYWGSLAGNGTPPATVEFSVADLPDYAVSRAVQDYPSFTVEGLSPVTNSLGLLSFTGELTCEGDMPKSSVANEVALTIILRDDQGKIVYGETSFVGGVSSGKTVPFEATLMESASYATAEAYVQPWI